MPEHDTEDDPRADREFNQGKQDSISTGAKIRGKMKRGEGTYDQDELVIEGRGGDTQEAIEDFQETLDGVEERGWMETMRDIRAEEDDG